MDSTLTGCLCAIGCEVLFGMSYAFTKQATGSASTFALLGWRFFIAFIAMSLLVMTGIMKVGFAAGENGGPDDGLKRQKSKGKRALREVFLIALFDPVIYFICETVGISRTTASESGVFLACIPVASLAASSVILRKKPGRVQTIGILITLAGVIFTVFAAGSGSASLSAAGYASLAAAVVSYALYSVFVESAESFSSAEITYMMIIAGAAVFGVLALAEALVRGDVGELLALPFRDKGFLAAVLYQGIGCSVLAFFLSNAAIARIGVNRTSSFIGISTVVSILAGALILNEAFTPMQAAGAAAIVAGVYAANCGSRRKDAAGPEK
jgi:drug/metabolite transporter (DMT)-like permease